jgi:hypothetical protein
MESAPEVTMVDLSKLIPIKQDPAEILRRRSAGEIYCADFSSGEGKYVATTFDSSDPIDASIKISPKVEVRFTYILNESRVIGLQITKLSSRGKAEKLHLSTLDWHGVLAILNIFQDIDLSSIAKGSLILNANIINDPAALKSFLNTVAADAQGKEKITEVAKNFNLLTPSYVSEMARRKKSSQQMDKLLNDRTYFDSIKIKYDIKKDEQVWQKFFERNDWMLGSDVIELLDDRIFDEHNTVDIPFRALDGFLDIVELKLPTAPFWTAENNPNAELIKAIMQCTRYISVAERKANDYEKIKELGCDIVKPRITLIYGRSSGWTDEQHKLLRTLNASLHNITILTYDHVLRRAQNQVKDDNNE